ncbi:hypothetical protein [Gilvimarinus polysaccharolyticus]|uniref:hypothetical protein n=1 Tax=Gilvimarinus polysaccharolyticus TaxID=863921 RepID=UPI0006739C3E|nr:hypothetical protein [Gilvimarinus polysaccharolyticus]
MVEHASEYPWSSYQHNAVGRTISFITPHELYNEQGKTLGEQQRAYRAFFKGRMPEADIQKIREATNKAWLLGSERFKRDFEVVAGRRAEPVKQGGDRKSQQWRDRNQRL